VTAGSIAGLFFAFMPGPPPPAIVVQPAPVAVVVTPPPPKILITPKAGFEELPDVSDSDLAVRHAFSALWAGHAKTALAEAEAVLQSEPNHVDALAAQAFALYELRRDRSARKVVKRALELDPQHPLANVLRGTMAQVEHDVSSALAHYEKYLRVRPRGELAEELASVTQTLTPSKRGKQ
jgi:Tfp pilus assembly protein PilF